jgi:hypothetical protein
MMANVILLVPARAEYMAAASQALSGQEISGAPATSDLPEGFTLDDSFPPVPVTADAITTTQAGADDALTGQMIVRGQMDDDTIAKYMSDTESTVRPFADPKIELIALCAGDPPLGGTAEVQTLLDTARLQSIGADGRNTAIAIVDGGINLAYLNTLGLNPTLLPAFSFSASSAITPGQAPLGHGTMCAYDSMIAAPAATLLDHAVLVRGISSGGQALEGLLSDAILSFSRLMVIMMQAAGTRAFQSLIVSNSWGVFDPSWDFPVGHAGRYLDNANHPFNLVTAALAASGADIVFAAGNCGTTCPDGRCNNWAAGQPVIAGANSHPDVLSMAGVDTGGTVVGYSSNGPGALTNDKPDLASYTHFLGSQAFGSGTPDSGTSAACPVMAGVVAALRSLYPYDPANANRSPSNVRDCLRTAAGGSWQADVGFGIVNTSVIDAGVAALT